MKHFKITFLLLIIIMNTFSSCTPESIAESDLLENKQANNNIQATSDEDKEIDKSGKED